MDYKIIKNDKYGFYEVENKPTPLELNEYYLSKYYQYDESKINKYQKTYSVKEEKFILNKIVNKFHLANLHYNGRQFKTAIDIGCGEGFALNYFVNKKIDSLGIDFSKLGIESKNPSIINNFRQGNVIEIIINLIEEKRKFDLLWLDNVLEHVLDPEDLIKKCNEICNEGGLIVIEVPNDFSKFQKYLSNNELIARKYWIAPPDHLNYFSPESLTKLCESFGWI